jgi:hypothetical protein
VITRQFSIFRIASTPIKRKSSLLDIDYWKLIKNCKLKIVNCEAVIYG